MSQPEKCKSNCELFGRHAEYFESFVVPLWQEVYDSLVERAHIVPGYSVLDVGTGTGETALRASRLSGKAGQVIGVDSEEEMLDIARRKASALRAGNLQFRRMSFEKLQFEDARFDRVIGNYSICCCESYNDALRECLRVLRPGGTITFNQSGPSDPIEFQIAFDLFEDYKTRRPSAKLRWIRQANLAQRDAVEKYRDPFTTLSLMRKIGFESAEAKIEERTIRYKDPDSFLDRMLAFSWRNEANEMAEERVSKFRAEAVRKLTPYATKAGFVVRDEMVTYSGRRPLD